MPTLPQRLLAGLVGYWPLATSSAEDLQAKFWTPGDPQPPDLTDHGTIARAAGPSNNLPNAAQLVNASSKYFSVATDAVLKGVVTGQFEVCGWVYLNSAVAFQTLCSMGRAGTDLAFELRTAGGGNEVPVLLVSADGTATLGAAGGTSTLSMTTWYFIRAGRRGPGGTQQFVSTNLGTEQVGGASGALFATPATFALGARATPSLYLDGRMAHWGLWNRSLSDAEATWLYNNGQGRDLTRGV